jgi:hypothetical protein
MLLCEHKQLLLPRHFLFSTVSIGCAMMPIMATKVLCHSCAKPLIGRQQRYCSKKCLCHANALTHPVGGWNRNPVYKSCGYCAQLFRVPACRIISARACSRRCLGLLQSQERKGVFGMGPTNPRYKNGIQIYRRLAYAAYGKICHDCHCVTGWIEVHHLNTDRTDNRIENLCVLCRSCHFKRHKMHKNFKIS